MKAPIEEIYSKSTICNFLFMVNSNCGSIAYCLQEIFVNTGLTWACLPTV